MSFVHCDACRARFAPALVEVPTEDGAVQHFDCPRCGRRYPVLRITTRGLELRDQLQVISGVARRAPLLAAMSREITKESE